MKEFIKRYKVGIFIILSLICLAAYEPTISYINTLIPTGGNLNVQGTLSINGTDVGSATKQNNNIASYTQSLIQNGTINTNSATWLASYPFAFQQYNGTPVGIDIWATGGYLTNHGVGTTNFETAVLMSLTNAVKLNLPALYKPGKFFYTIDPSWNLTNYLGYHYTASVLSYTNWNPELMPNGFTNILAYAHSNGIAILPYSTPYPSDGSSPFFNTNYEGWGTWLAQMGFDGGRIDYLNNTDFNWNQKMQMIWRVYNAFVAADTNRTQPIFAVFIGDTENTLSNMNNINPPPGTVIFDGEDPASPAIAPGDYAQFTNVWGCLDNYYQEGAPYSRWISPFVNNLNAFTNASSNMVAVCAMTCWPSQYAYVGVGENESTITNSDVIKILNYPTIAKILYNNITNECLYKFLANGEVVTLVANRTTNTTLTAGFTGSAIGFNGSDNYAGWDLWGKTNVPWNGNYFSNSLPPMMFSMIRWTPIGHTFATETTITNRYILYPPESVNCQAAVSYVSSFGAAPFYHYGYIKFNPTNSVSPGQAIVCLPTNTLSVTLTMPMFWEGTNTINGSNAITVYLLPYGNAGRTLGYSAIVPYTLTATNLTQVSYTWTDNVVDTVSPKQLLIGPTASYPTANTAGPIGSFVEIFDIELIITTTSSP